MATVLAVLGLYLVPTLVGIWRRVPRLERVVIVNVFLGWTFAGWVVALGWALEGRNVVLLEDRFRAWWQDR